MSNAMSIAEKNALSVSYEVLGTRVEMDLDFVKKYLVRGQAEKITNQEIVFFMNTCKMQKLNPLVSGEVYCIKFGNEPAQMVVGKGAYLRRAFEHPDYICKEDGTNIAVSQSVAEGIANNLNLGVMPAEDDAGYDSASDGVCRLVLMLYKSGSVYRSTANVTWLTDAPSNSQDILGIAHNNGFATDADDVTTTMWYDWSNNGTTYTTATGTADSIETDIGCGVVCKFNRTVISPNYNMPCKNFRYKVEARSVKNSTTTINAMVQADYYRGISKLSANLDVDVIALLSTVVTGDPFYTAISLVPEYESDFADVLQADIMYTINP